MVGGAEDEDPPDPGGVDLSVGVGGAGAAVAVAGVRADDGAGAARRDRPGLGVCQESSLITCCFEPDFGKVGSVNLAFL